MTDLYNNVYSCIATLLFRLLNILFYNKDLSHQNWCQMVVSQFTTVHLCSHSKICSHSNICTVSGKDCSLAHSAGQRKSTSLDFGEGTRVITPTIGVTTSLAMHDPLRHLHRQHFDGMWGDWGHLKKLGGNSDRRSCREPGMQAIERKGKGHSCRVSELESDPRLSIAGCSPPAPGGTLKLIFCQSQFTCFVPDSPGTWAAWKKEH